MLVVVDDIAALSWIGHPSSDVARFLRALTALCAQVNPLTFLSLCFTTSRSVVLTPHSQESIALVVRHHTVIPDEPSQDDFFRILLQLSSLHFDVLPLASGKSGAVSGQACPSTSMILPDAPLNTLNSRAQHMLPHLGRFLIKNTRADYIDRSPYMLDAPSIPPLPLPRSSPAPAPCSIDSPTQAPSFLSAGRAPPSFDGPRSVLSSAAENKCQSSHFVQTLPGPTADEPEVFAIRMPKGFR